MDTVEKIQVYIRFDKGKATCICPRDKKKCKKDCTPDVVTRDKFIGWESTMKRNRYGK